MLENLLERKKARKPPELLNKHKIMLEKQRRRYRRHKKIRAKVFGTKEKPRFFVFRSNKHIYTQLIDDQKGETIVSVSDKEVKEQGGRELALEVGKLTAKKALEKDIKSAVFDRAGYRYHGKVKLIAEGAKEGGLKI